MEIMWGYGIVTQLSRTIKGNWEGDRFTARSVGIHGEVFTETWGVTQGNLISTTILNTVVQHYLKYVCEYQVEEQILGIKIIQKCMIFYADNRRLKERDGEWLQSSFDGMMG